MSAANSVVEWAAARSLIISSQYNRRPTLVARVIYWWHMSDKPQPNVIIYSAGWCAFCHAAKQYLDQKGIKYTDKDVERDMANAQEAVQKSGQMGIPVLDINGTIILGFDRPRIDAALSNSK